MIFKEIVFEVMLLVQYWCIEKNGFKDNHKSYILVFGTARLNTCFLLDLANKGNIMMCRSPNMSLKSKRLL